MAAHNRKLELPRTTVDWDTSQADDFRTRGVPWTIKRTLLERGRALRSDRNGLAQRRSGAMSDDGLTAAIQGVLAARPWSRSAKARGGTSAGLPRRSPAV